MAEYSGRGAAGLQARGASRRSAQRCRDQIDSPVRQDRQRGNENCPMKAQTVQNMTTISEFIHSAGMANDSKELNTYVLLDGAQRPCSTLYRRLLNCNP
jgi:hypothetical protein